MANISGGERLARALDDHVVRQIPYHDKIAGVRWDKLAEGLGAPHCGAPSPPAPRPLRWARGARLIAAAAAVSPLSPRRERGGG